jgi:DNA-binding IclR family transcriptional regulator
MKSYRALIRAANNAGVTLTYAHKNMFLRMLKLAVKKGVCTGDGYCINLTVQKLAKALKIPLRTVIQGLSRLAACGVIERIEGNKTFPISPMITKIALCYFESEVK